MSSNGPDGSQKELGLGQLVAFGVQRESIPYLEVLDASWCHHLDDPISSHGGEFVPGRQLVSL